MKNAFCRLVKEFRKALTVSLLQLFNALQLVLLTTLSYTSHAATTPNTAVVNTATATYKVDGKSLSVTATSAVNTAVRTPSSIALLGVVSNQHNGAQVFSVNPGNCLLVSGSASLWQVQGSIQSIFGGSLVAPTAVSTVASTTFSGRDVLMVMVNDPDQNLDSQRVERVTVEVFSSTDRETLQLAETGPSTGQFIGWIKLVRQTAVVNDCLLAVSVSDTVRARYVDARDGEDIVSAAALVDPYGTVFDSQTGAPVNGALVSIIDTKTGLPATVYGDDGVSSYPNVYLTGRDVTDGSGTLYAAGAGRYRFPLVAPGIYRFDVKPPEGYTFPSKFFESQVPKSIAELYSVSVGAKGEEFPVPVGPAVRIDIPIDPRIGKLLLDKTSTRVQAAVGDLIRYNISLRNSDSAMISRVTLVDSLPQGLRLRAGSAKDSKGNALKVVSDPNGRSFQIQIGDLPGNHQVALSYLTEVTPSIKIGKATNEATAVGAGTRSNSASATVQIVDDLMLSRAILVGHVYEGECPQPLIGPSKEKVRGLQNARVILHDGRYAVTDLNGRWHLEGVAPGTTSVRLDRLSLPAGQIALPCSSNPRRSGGQLAQTIHVQPGSLNRIDFYTQSTAPSARAKNSPLPSIVTDEPKAVIAADQISTAEQLAWQLQRSELSWAYPRDGITASEGYQSFLVVHRVGQRVVLEHQGEPVAGFHFEGTKVGPDGVVATSLWRNVHLQNGANRFAARILDGNNNPLQVIERVLHLATAPVRAALVVERSNLKANGRESATIAIRLFDSNDQPVRKDITGEFSLNSPYTVKEVADAVAKHALAPYTSPVSKYVVGADGIAMINLSATTQSGEVELRFNFSNGRTQTLRAWLHDDQRDWIIVGFAEGSPIGVKLRQQLQANRSLIDSPIPIEGGRLALYAKGSIAGQALLTLAYDSAKSKSDLGHQPQSIAVAPFYTIYGDQSQSGIETQSYGKLFLKIEKSTFLALLGNTNTNLTVSELGRHAQAMYGLRSSWQSERLAYSAFVMRNLTSAHRDVIRADGTTGSWPLSRQLIVPNTETVRVITRNRLDISQVMSDRILARATDYSFDYVSGRIQLAQPVPIVDAALNPITIEVEFSTEINGLNSNSMTVGGRVAFKPSEKIEVGLTLIKDNDATTGGRLAAIDLNATIFESTRVKLEQGMSSRTDNGLQVSSHASLVELRHDQPDWSSRLYYRRAEPFFGLKNQPAATTDLQTYGAEVRTNLSETLQLDSQLSSQTKISSDQTAQVAQSRLVFSDKTWQSTVGLRLGREKTALGVSAEVNQLLASIGYTSPEQPWSLRVGAEVGNEKGRDQEIRLFPNRITIDADYRFTDRLSFTMSHHWLLARERSTEAHVGLRYASWQGAELQVGVSQRGWSDGQSTALRSSLVQTAKLNNLWTLNAQLTDSRLIDGTFSSQNFALSSGNTQLVTSPVTQPATQGDDFMSAGVTLSVNAKPWSGYFRAEKRWAEQSRLSLAGGISYHFNTDQHLISTLRVERSSEETSPSFQWTATHVLRPQFSPWSVLSRFEYIDNQHRASTSGSTQALSSGSNSNITGPITLTAGRRLLLSSHVNFLANNGLEWLNRLGYKRVLESYDQTNYGTSFIVLGTELRKPIGKTFDIGLHAVYARSLSNNVTNRSYGISVGARLLPNSVLTVGYNFKGIEDRDFYASNQRAAGVFVWLRMLLDENLLGLSSATASALLESQ